MAKFEFVSKLRDFFTSAQAVKVSAFIGFTVLMTAVIASQNFFFQNIIENGISKRDIIAQKTLTVEDKKEVSQKIEPVMAPAEDDFIKSNLQTLQSSIMQIRKKDVDEAVKNEEIGILFDLSDNSKKDFIINFLLKADDNSLREVFDKANLTLSNILRAGITEKDYEKDNIDKIILNNLVSNVSKRQVSVIKAVLEQVIVPNLVVDEFATEIARKNAQNSVKPYEVIFQKGACSYIYNCIYRYFSVPLLYEIFRERLYGTEISLYNCLFIASDCVYRSCTANGIFSLCNPCSCFLDFNVNIY